MIKKYKVRGLVQGIGFRPFVAEIAEELNIEGWVRNSGGIVTIVCSANESVLKEFKQRLISDVPTGGFVSNIDEEDALETDYESGSGFMIIESDLDQSHNLPFIPADIATCKACEKELLDPDNRRYGHPFISCTVCGPRYSILKSLPYDRETITMGDFEMCPQCYSEYVEKKNTRRHAQTIACNNCGPKLSMSIDEAADVIKQGGILAIKDIGGYHLACDPFNEKAVADLRRLKHREAKAFALLFESVADVRKYCEVSSIEEKLLESPARPIVLCRKKRGVSTLSEGVCLSSPDIGAMLPCNPVQILLAKKCGPMIMTSGNASGDTLEIDDEKMKSWVENRMTSPEMEGVEIKLLSHNRRILRPLDDSVIKVVAGRTQFIRRARGYVPNPIAVDIQGEIFAAGGDLKSSFCYVKNGFAYVSQYLGDLETISCQNSYKKEVEAMKDIFGFESKVKAVDKHPGYFSRNLIKGDVEVQHHKAHVASVIAEHKLSGDVLGFAFDGTGFGDDGNIWGSEIFKCDNVSMERIGHLKPVKLIGGDEGAKNCETILKGYLHSFNNNLVDENDLVCRALDMGINTVISTSMGRLFDAVSALLGICSYNSYEGQAPIELENEAAKTEYVYPLFIDDDGDTKALFSGIINAMENKVESSRLARGFIYAVADFVYSKAESTGIKQIVLSGGSFLNRILTERVIELFEENGYKVYIAQALPPGDGGICLGQAYLAAKSQQDMLK